MPSSSKLFFSRRLGQFTSVLVIVSAWELLAVTINNSRLLPGIDYLSLVSLPSFARFAQPPSDNLPTALVVIGKHMVLTLVRVIIGFGIGLLVGLLVGMAIHFFYRSRKTNAFLLSVIRAVPLFALIPLFLQWFGGGETGIYIYIAFGVFVVISTNTYEAIRNVNPAHALQAQLLGASRIQVFRTVYAYATMPELAGSLRNVVGLCWAFSLGAEYLAADSGLGYLVYQSYLYSDMGKMIVLAVLYAVLGIISYNLFKPIFYNMRKWHVHHSSGAR